jgi:hypothetical protein
MNVSVDHNQIITSPTEWRFLLFVFFFGSLQVNVIAIILPQCRIVADYASDICRLSREVDRERPLAQ